MIMASQSLSVSIRCCWGIFRGHYTSCMYWLYIITSVWMLLIFQLRIVGIWYCDNMKEFWNIWMECVIWYCGVTVFPITSSFSQPAFYHHQCYYCLWKLKCKRTSQLWTSHGANPSTRSLCCCLWWWWFWLCRVVS